MECWLRRAQRKRKIRARAIPESFQEQSAPLFRLISEVIEGQNINYLHTDFFVTSSTHALERRWLRDPYIVYMLITKHNVHLQQYLRRHPSPHLRSFPRRESHFRVAAPLWGGDCR